MAMGRSIGARAGQGDCLTGFLVVLVKRRQRGRETLRARPALAAESVESVDRLDTFRVRHLDIDCGGVQVGVPQQRLCCPQVGATCNNY